MDLTSYRAFLIELAAESGAFIRPFFGRTQFKVELKADQTEVTEADRGAEALMRASIERRFPHHGIIGEEYGSVRSNAEWVWVLDPIDGTKSFIGGVPLWGTLIALQYQGQPVLGCIHQPVLNQLVVGDPQGTTLNGRPVRLRSCAKLEEAELLTTDVLSPSRHQDGAAFDRVMRRVRQVRTWGDCYGYLTVACGGADIMCDPVMNPWDIQALIPVIRGAGGTITDWQGRDPVKGTSIVAALPEIHRQLIAALNPSP